MQEKINVGIIGGTGYTGGELCRLLLNHENINNIYPTSRKKEDFEKVHQNLLGSGLKFIKQEDLEKKLYELDVVFTCTPTGEASKIAPKFLENNIKVIDLSADFRFKNLKDFNEAHNKEHYSSELLNQGVYGVTEFNREKIKKTNLLANPGCYVITSLLGIAPLLKNDIIDLEKTINMNGINGTSGAGNKPKKEIMHAEAMNSMLPYNMEGHRHSEELEDQIKILSSESVNVNFNTAHGNFVRGIYMNITPEVKPELKNKISRESLLDLYEDFYKDEFFVRINKFSKLGEKTKKQYDVYPNVARVQGSNFCDIGLDYDSKRGIIKIVSVTDNLVKGAAGSAIQNMNVMFGFDEKQGLTSYGL